MSQSRLMQGSVLLEGLLAVLIFSVGVLALIGMQANAIKAEVADRLTKAGQPPKVLTAGAVVGTAKATELFEAAYDEHARRIAKYYAKLGS